MRSVRDKLEMGWNRPRIREVAITFGLRPCATPPERKYEAHASTSSMRDDL